MTEKINATFFAIVIAVLITAKTFSQWQTNGPDIYYNGGNVGLGTSEPSNRLTIVGNELTKPSLLLKNSSYKSTNSTGTVSLQFAFANHIGPKIEAAKTTNNITALNFYVEYGFNNLQHGLIIKPSINGQFIGVGTTNPDSKLTVKGKIHAEEVKVDLSVPGPDYVFKEGYDLKSLEEVKNYIKEHGHLPNIPSAKEMEANGVKLGEMNMKLLEKIEELTIYILSQNQESHELRKSLFIKGGEIAQLKKRLEKIEKLTTVNQNEN